MLQVPKTRKMEIILSEQVAFVVQWSDYIIDSAAFQHFSYYNPVMVLATEELIFAIKAMFCLLFKS